MIERFTCPVDLCSASMTHRQVMCYHHWTHVPQPLQRKVMGAWRAMHKASNLYRQGMIHRNRYLVLTEARDALRNEAIRVASEKCGHVD